MSVLGPLMVRGLALFVPQGVLERWDEVEYPSLAEVRRQVEAR